MYLEIISILSTQITHYLNKKHGLGGLGCQFEYLRYLVYALEQRNVA